MDSEGSCIYLAIHTLREEEKEILEKQKFQLELKIVKGGERNDSNVCMCIVWTWKCPTFLPNICTKYEYILKRLLLIIKFGKLFDWNQVKPVRKRSKVGPSRLYNTLHNYEF